MEKLIELPRMTRGVEVRASTFDEEKRTIEMVWTTGATVRRNSWIDGPYDESLVVSTKAIRLERLNAGAPLLNSHNGYDLEGVIGSVVSARIENGVGIATVKLSGEAEDAAIVNKIRDGIIRNISVGYRVHAIEKQERDDGSVPLWTITDWEPLELSAVPIPADAGAQFRAEDKRELFAAVLTSEGSEIIFALARMRMQARELGLAV